MKAFSATILLLLCATPAATGRSEDRLSPVTRTVELMKGLAEKIEQDGKAEEDLYETFVCWAKSIISQKTASNTAATSRIDSLTTYIADLDAGRIELTSERQDLEKDIEKLKGEIEIATETRAKEKKDYEDAEDELQKTIKALEDAIEVLKEATAGHESGVLLSIKGQMSEGFSARASQAASLRRAAELGEKVLTKGDAAFLHRLLTAEVPTADWKKLNRKATFKMSYKARSFKIQGVLQKLLETMNTNLKEATDAENEAQALFDKLEKSKSAELKAAETALQDMVGEKGAKALSRNDAQTEVDELTAQVDADKKYIDQVKGELATKKLEWKDRMALREGELAAISKAIEILHNDDSRDLFKKSFASHDESAMFLQESAGLSARAHQRHGVAAAQALRAAGQQAADVRLNLLAARLQSGGHFDEVIKAIDAMIATLKDEEKSDLEKKETCEQDRADDTRSAVLASRAIDEMSDKISTLQSEIADLKKEIAEKTQTIADITQELKEAKEMREKENAEYLQNKKDDEDAAALVEASKGVLESFYKDNNLVFMQAKKQAQPFESEAGKAPPPPPTTWDAPYGGATGESQGIVAILEMIHDDILKDIAKADKEEQDALDMYTKTKTALNNDVTNLNGQINSMNTTQSDKELEVESTKGDKSTKKSELETVMKKIADADDFCNFFTINYPLRLKNRQVEMDGLDKAKAILEGGAFATPADPNREMKPGDALVQKAQRHNILIRRAA